MGGGGQCVCGEVCMCECSVCVWGGSQCVCGGGGVSSQCVCVEENLLLPKQRQPNINNGQSLHDSTASFILTPIKGQTLYKGCMLSYPGGGAPLIN